MSKHWEKQIKDAQATVQEIGRRPEPTEPMTRQQVESFVKGFEVSPAAQRRMVDAWMADQQRTRSKAYDDGWESGHADADTW